jgi:putative ABC transport system permease protein
MEELNYTFLASFLLVAISLLYSYKEGLGIEKKIAVGSLIALVQLLTLGVALSFLFSFDSMAYYAGVWLFMCFYASFIANRRTSLYGGGFWVAFISIAASSFCVLLLLLLIGAISLKAKEVIPLSGMITGNALNVYTQFADRLKGEAKNRITEIEGKSALGADISEALSEAVKAASKASMMPTLNTLQAVGFIHIPGVTVGMILAGASPMKAVSFQLVIMFMMVSVAMFSAIFGKILLVKKITGSIGG